MMHKLLTILCLALSLNGCKECYANPSEIVLQTIAMESSNQSDYGQYLVASVIVNRAKVSNSTTEKVCLARRQFSCWNDSAWAKAWLGRHYDQKSRGGAEMALKRAIREPFKGITHYHTIGVHPYWANGKKACIIEGQHKFYSNIN